MPSQSMPNTNSFERPAAEGGAKLGEDLVDRARQAGAALTQTAQQARDQASETASSLASEAQERLQGYMDQQVAAGAGLAGRVASAIKTAADELSRSSPMLGDMVRGASERVDDLSHQFRDKTADEILADTRDLVRRKPALVFGAAAALGFVAYRILNAGIAQTASREPRFARGDDWRRSPSNGPSRSAQAGFGPHTSPGRIHAD
jgi:ElaB/YqjD/DUF883 family membrane-anchored ribosome-binding protein